MEQMAGAKAPAQGFVSVSLGDWITLAQETGTPHVPTVEIARVRVRARSTVRRAALELPRLCRATP